MIDHEKLHGHFRKMTFCYVRFMVHTDITVFCEGIQTSVYHEADFQVIGVIIEGLALSPDYCIITDSIFLSRMRSTGCVISEKVSMLYSNFSEHHRQNHHLSPDENKFTGGNKSIS